MSLSTVGPRRVIRASGSVVANGAANSSNVSLPSTATQKLMVFIDFTKGSLTSATFTPQVSSDGTNWYDVTSPAALQLSADGAKAFVVDCTGAKLFRVQTSSAGTTTGSDCTIAVCYRKS